MLVALILTQENLERDLGETVLWRRNMERRLARTLDEARRHAAARRPDVVIVDSRFPDAPVAVAALRRDERTHAVSMVVLAFGDFDPSEIDILQSGANAILRLPPGADWDDRLVRLIHVPQRKAARLPVHLLVEDGYPSGEKVLPVTALNLSVNGMLVESLRPLRIGEDVQFAFHLPNSTAVVAGSGTVIRLADGSARFGIELTHVHGDGRVRIKLFVESRGD